MMRKMKKKKVLKKKRGRKTLKNKENKILKIKKRKKKQKNLPFRKKMLMIMNVSSSNFIIIFNNFLFYNIIININGII